MKLTDLGNGQYIALETFKQNGDGVITPVWVAADGDRLLVWTQAGSWKVKHIRANSRVRVCPSDIHGNPTGNWLEARASVLDDPAAEAALQRLLAEKYGEKFHRLDALRKTRGKKIPARVVIEITAAP